MARRDDLDLDLRYGAVRRAVALRPRLPHNLRQLGASGPLTHPVAPQGTPVVVKIGMTHAHTTGQHLRYLQQSSKGLGQQPMLFGPAMTDRAAFVHAAQQDPRQFRLIVSAPEQEGFARTTFIDRLMAQMERDLGRPLIWVAAHHYDTAHPHTHIVLRAVDGRGHEFFFPKHYWMQGLRNRAQNLLNAMSRLQTQHLSRNVETTARYRTRSLEVAQRLRSLRQRTHARDREHGIEMA